MAKEDKNKTLELTLEDLPQSITPTVDVTRAGTLFSEGPDIISGSSSSNVGTSFAEGPDITSRVGLSNIGTSFAEGPNITAASSSSHLIFSATLYKPGDSILINGVTYQYEGVISKSTGEAEIHLISTGVKKYVLKLYWPNFKPKDEILKTLKLIDHEDIINLQDYGYDHDRFFEIMDYASGGSLDKHLPIKDITKLKGIVAEVINAYKFIHSKDLVHKDIKPENLFYKNVDETDILIGDFGISTALEVGMTRNLTKQTLTPGYAAPEMYGFGNQSIIGKEVDYYALGITLLHLWDGISPFEGLKTQQISNLTISGNVRFPKGLPGELEKLVKGLITIDYTKRWGYEEVSRWLNGEDVPVHFQVVNANNKPFRYSPNVEVSTTAELVEVMKLSPGVGTKLLYRGKISAWVNLFNDVLAGQLDMITEDDYPSDQNAGFKKALFTLELTLEPQMPFTYINKEYRSASELADMLEVHFSHFSSELKNANHEFYLYLEARDAKAQADAFRKYFQTFSAKKSLNTIILDLRGRESFKINNQAYFTPAEVLNYKDKNFLENELKDKESSLSLWIEGTDDNNIKAQLDDWRGLKKSDYKTLAYVSPNGNGIPQIEISKSNFSFNDIRVRTQTNDSFTVTNKGGGKLSGSITSNKSWLQIKQDKLDAKKTTQEIKFTVDTSKLPYDTKEIATIEIDSNIGREEIEVRLSVEQGAKAAARFRNAMIVGAALVGGLLGFVLGKFNGQSRDIALCAGLIGALGCAIFKGRQATVNFKTDDFIWTFIIVIAAVGLLSYAPDVHYSTLAWALLFAPIAALAAPMILKDIQLGQNANPIMIGTATVILSIGIIIFGSKNSEIADEISLSKKLTNSSQISTNQAVLSNSKRIDWKNPPNLSLKGFGPIKIGMSVDELRQVLNEELRIYGNINSGSCFVGVPVESNSENQISFIFDQSKKLAVISIISSQYQTLSGARVGQHIGELNERYEGRLVQDKHKYAANGFYFTYTPDDVRDDKYRMIFESGDGQGISLIKTGKLPEVEFVDGCDTTEVSRQASVPIVGSNENQIEYTNQVATKDCTGFYSKYKNCVQVVLNKNVPYIRKNLPHTCTGWSEDSVVRWTKLDNDFFAYYSKSRNKETTVYFYDMNFGDTIGRFTCKNS